jgi:TolB protein
VLALALAAVTSVIYLQRGNGGIVRVAASPDVGGRIAYAAGGSIWLYEGGKAEKLTKGPADRDDKHDASPTLSPDGTQIIYTRFDEGFSDLYKLDVSSPSDATALSNHRPSANTGEQGYASEALWAMQPAWSPDGDHIAFTTDRRTEYPGLYSMDPFGDNVTKLENLDHSTQAVEHPTWSPDGTRIAVANYVSRNGTGQIWMLNIESGKWTELTDAKDGTYDPAWSPDGEWIAFAMREGTATNIYAVPTDSTKWEGDFPKPIKLTTDGASRSPVWSPDGNRLAYIALHDTSFDIYAARVALDALSNPTLEDIEHLTENAHIDAPSGLSWAR